MRRNLKRDASLTVEAAFILPIFLVALQAFLLFLQMFFIHEELQYGMNEAGKVIAKQAYFIERLELPDEGEEEDFSDDTEIARRFITNVGGTIYIHRLVKEYVDIDLFERSAVEKGFTGVSFLDSRYSKEQIELVASYKVCIPISFMNKFSFFIKQRVKFTPWIGTQIASKVAERQENEENVEEEQIVYITGYQSVYHTNRNCTHLNLSMSAIKGADITERRNKNGKIYSACGKCAKGEIKEEEQYIITDWGEKYHTTYRCGGITRSVKEVKRKEITDKTECMRCREARN